MKPPVFGEWLQGPVKGVALRLVIEEMSQRSSAPSVTAAALKTSPETQYEITVSSGTAVWPWHG